jgi:hypothetical protein
VVAGGQATRPRELTPRLAGPLVIETLFKHFISHKALMKDSKARGDDLMYDEGESGGIPRLLSHTRV